jgi:thiol-disulfide isomerase/thioredoxin
MEYLQNDFFSCNVRYLGFSNKKILTRQLDCWHYIYAFFMIMNKKYWFLLFFSFYYLASVSAQQVLPPGLGHEVTIKSNYKNVTVYIGAYYGRLKTLVDSVTSDENGIGRFAGPDKWTPGIYFFVTPKKAIDFEFLMDENQHFRIDFDTASRAKLVVYQSPDNEIFADYTSFLARISPRLQQLQAALAKAVNPADSTAKRAELAKASAELTEYRNKLMEEKPGSLLARLLQVAKIPETPSIPVLPDGSRDSQYAYKYVKGHYWDNVDFYEDMLLFTPFFESKLDEYFKYYVSPVPDSIIAEVDYILMSARAGKDIYRYLLGKFTDQYIQPKIMGQDKVFLHLFQEYYLNGDTSWLNEKQRQYIFNRGYSLFANQINEMAPPLTLADTSGKQISLYEIQSPFTFIAFWDPQCGHCKEKIPELDSLYKAKWKALGVHIFAVCVKEYLFFEWKNFINEKNLVDWTHAYQTKEEKTKVEASSQPSYHQLYDIQQTPTFYLLDADKRIIAKSLTLEQYDKIIETKLQEKGETF